MYLINNPTSFSWLKWCRHLSFNPFEVFNLLCRYEDAFIRFVDEINALAAYQWWEGSVYSILSVFVYPLAWSWLQRCRKKKLQQLREYVRSEYDHACLRSCRSRALYEGLKVHLFQKHHSFYNSVLFSLYMDFSFYYFVSLLVWVKLWYLWSRFFSFFPWERKKREKRKILIRERKLMDISNRVSIIRFTFL